MTRAYDEICARLLNVTGRSGRNGSWCCPAHDDRNPSMSVTASSDGVLMCCHGPGCPIEDIMAALDLPLGALFDDWWDRRNGSTGSDNHILRVHDYIDEEGTLLYQTVRFDGTGSDRFRQRRPDGKGGWIWKMGDSRRVLYNLSLVLEAIKQGKPILITEGEHDADALIRAGAVATTNPLGATNWKPEYTRMLADAKVVIVVDRDETGYTRGARLKAEFEAAGNIELLGVLEPVKGKDAAAVLGMGYEIDTGFVPVRDLPEVTQNTHNPGYRATRLADVTPERVEWLATRRLPRGKVVTFVGDPDVGKSTLCLDCTAKVTTGRPLFDDVVALAPPSAVVWMTAEDGLADTVRRRLDAAGADTKLVHHLDAVYHADDKGEWVESFPTIPDDLEALEALINDTDAVLVFVDVLFAYLSGKVKASNDQEVRRAFAPLSALAERTGACVVLIAHIPKSQRHSSTPITVTPGAMGVGGGPRAGMLAAADPDDETGVRKVLARTKGNLAPPWPSLAYRLKCSACGGSACDGTDDGLPVIEWLGESAHSGRDLLVPRQDDDDRSALADAKDWLRSVLSAPRLKREVVKEARSEDIKDMTLKRAAKELGVVSERDDKLQGRPATWSLPGYGS